MRPWVLLAGPLAVELISAQISNGRVSQGLLDGRSHRCPSVFVRPPFCSLLDRHGDSRGVRCQCFSTEFYCEFARPVAGFFGCAAPYGAGGQLHLQCESPQGLTPMMPTQQNRPWTEEEERRLLEMRTAGRSIRSISAALKRSSGAINARISILRARARRGTEAGSTISNDR